MERVLFSEEQRFTQWWLWLIMTVTLLAIVIPIGISIQSEWLSGKPFNQQPDSVQEATISGVISLLIMGIIFFLIFGSKLKTKITNEGMYVSYPPIRRKWKQILPDEIDHYEIRTYRAKREYGGYGVRRRRRNGQAYIISGNIGLQLYFKNGKRLLVGTQKKQAIELAMKKMMQLQ